MVATNSCEQLHIITDARVKQVKLRVAGNNINQDPGGLDKVYIGLLGSTGAWRESGREVYLSLLGKHCVNIIVLILLEGLMS